MLGSTENHTIVYGYWIIINYEYYLIIIIVLLHDSVEGETIFLIIRYEMRHIHVAAIECEPYFSPLHAF
jgi:hypothetical protein